VNSPATVVPTNNDMIDFKVIDGVVEHTEHRHIGVIYQVGDVAGGENLARIGGGNLIVGDAAIGATNPEILWLLARGQALEESGVLVIFASHKDTVSLE